MEEFCKDRKMIQCKLIEYLNDETKTTHLIREVKCKNI